MLILPNLVFFVQFRARYIPRYLECFYMLQLIDDKNDMLVVYLECFYMLELYDEKNYRLMVPKIHANDT